MTWRVSFVAVVAACGRYGFGGVPTPDATADASVTVAALCAPQDLGNVVLTGGEGVASTRVLDVPGAIAVGVRSSTNNLYLLKLNTDLTINSQHLPLASNYQLWSVNVVAGNLLVGCFDTGDGHGYLKAISADWNSYVAEQAGGAMVLDPPLAPIVGGVDALYSYVDATGALAMEVIDGSGVTQSTMPTGLTGVASASVAPASGGAVTVAALTDGTCRYFGVDTTAASGAMTSIASCASPIAATLADGTLAIAYVSNNDVHAYVVPPGGAAVDFMLGAGGAPRLLAHAGAFVASWTDPTSQLAVLALVTASGARITTTDAPGATFDLVRNDPRAFWITGTTVSTASVCLQQRGV